MFVQTVDKEWCWKLFPAPLFVYSLRYRHSYACFAIVDMAGPFSFYR